MANGPTYADLAIYDDVLPSPASPFRTLEYGHYLDFFQSSVLISLEAWHFGFAHAGFGDLRAILPIEERLKARILPFEQARGIVPRLAYVTFLGNAQRLMPYLETRRIPFILQLYPGGSFEPNVEASDESLRDVVQSPLCRKVIATQILTRDHLARIGCSPEKVEFIYGGVFDSRVSFNFERDKFLFGRDKDTLDICFVAHRYGSDMAHKGYDQFVQVAHLLAGDSRLRFHIVGDYGPADVPLGEVATRFNFHGRQPTKFFAAFYPRMDVILSPNRPASTEKGSFDGFPTGACMEAGFRGVLNCITDPLALNVAFEDGRNILLIDRDAARTAARLAALFAAPDQLYALARANCARYGEVFDVDRQLWSRTRLITSELLREEALVVRPAASFGALQFDSLRALESEKFKTAIQSYIGARDFWRETAEAWEKECQRLSELIGAMSNRGEKPSNGEGSRHQANAAQLESHSKTFTGVRNFFNKIEDRNLRQTWAPPQLKRIARRLIPGSILNRTRKG
jgi:hypothetical protein